MSQLADVWATPLPVASTSRLAEPVLLSDSSGAVHLFFGWAADPAQRTSELRYARWADGRWSEPATVITGNNVGALREPSVVLDQRGWLHVAYLGPSSGQVAYQRIHLSELGDAQAWSRPKTLSDGSGMHVALATGPNDALYAVYSGHGQDVIFQRSEDGGRSWLGAQRLSKLDLSQQACDDPRLAVDGRGRIHAVWTQFPLPKAWPPAGVYYRRSDDGGRTWSATRQVAAEAGRINVAAGGDEVHLVWTDDATFDRMHQWSANGGETWSTPQPIGERARGAITRGLVLAYDSAGVLHLVTSTGFQGSSEPPVHMTWRAETGWSAPYEIAKGMGKSEPGGFPSLAIAGGNRLHVAYKARDGGIWYAQAQAAAPPIAAQPVPARADDVWSRWKDASLPFRILVVLLALFGTQASVAWLLRVPRERRLRDTLIRAGNAWSTLRARVQNGPPAWLPWVCALAVVAAAIAIGRTSPNTALLLGGALAVATVIAPPLGAVGLIAGMIGSPLAIATGTHTDISFPIVALAALTTVWGISVLWRRDLRVFQLPAVHAICALALVAAAATALGNSGWVGFDHTAPLTAQLGGLYVFVASAAAVVLGAELLRDERWLRRVTWVYLAFTGLLIASQLIWEARALGGLFVAGASGSLTWTWFAGLASAQALLNRDLNWRVRLLLALAVVGELYVAMGVSREWVAGWLPALIAIAIVGYLTAPRLALAGGALIAIAGAANLHRVVMRVFTGGNQYSLDTRLDAWTIVLSKIVPANPILGLGPANYYHVTPQFPIRGYAVNFSSHSTYVDLLAQTGIIGLACFVWFVWAMARVGWRLRMRARSGFARAYVVGALGGLAGTLAAGGLGDWVLPFVYNVTLEGLRSSLPAWFLLGGLLALWRNVEPSGARAVTATAPSRWTTGRILAAITAGAVVLRVVVALALGDTVAPIAGGVADQYSYDTLAQRVVDGYGFSFASDWYPFAQADTPTAHWSYLYTLYLAAVYALFGHHPLIARLLQAVASGAACWFLFRLGRRLYDERVALTAAALGAVYAYFVFFSATLMTQAFFILALLAALDRAVAIAERPTTARWLGLGLCLGIGVLLRQSLLLFAPLLLGWLAWITRARGRWRDSALAVAVISLCVLPWTIRNYVGFGQFLLLNSNGGYFLYASNHPHQGTSFDPNYVAPLPPELVGQSEPVVDRALMRIALGFITADPVRFVKLSISRVERYFWLLPSAVSTPLSNAARVCSFALYAPLMLYGLWLSRRNWRACMPLYLYVAVDTLLHLSSWAAPRYRLPSDALLVVFAALAVVDVVRRLGWLPQPAVDHDDQRGRLDAAARAGIGVAV